MMKKILILVVSLMIFEFSLGQNHDYQWLFGYQSNTIDSSFGGTNFDFNSSPPDIYYIFRNMDFGSVNAAVCDDEGNLMFYSNGCEIVGKDQNLLINGDSLNPGDIYDNYCYPVGGSYPSIADLIILPMSNNKYYLIHKDIKQTFINSPPSVYIFSSNLYYSEVNLNNNEVVLKNKSLLNDTLTSSDLNAVKHSNGEDWWFFARKNFTNTVFKLLATPDTIILVGSQSIGSSLLGNEGGQSVFSPDGSKYIYYDVSSDIMIYDFNRETGLLSNFNHIPLADSVGVLVGGVAVSSNSRFLYVSNTFDVYQYDLLANDVGASRVHIANWDGFSSPDFATNFYRMQLAPDCKIYINSFNSVDYMHVIHQPNLKGQECDLEQHGIKLKTVNWPASLPTHPHYRIDANEICDSTISKINSTSLLQKDNTSLNLFPNPVLNQLTILSDYENIDAIKVFDIYGKLVIDKTLMKSIKRIQVPVELLSPGVYWVEISTDFNKTRTKIIKH